MAGAQNAHAALLQQSNSCYFLFAVFFAFFAGAFFFMVTLHPLSTKVDSACITFYGMKPKGAGGSPAPGGSTHRWDTVSMKTTSSLFSSPSSSPSSWLPSAIHPLSVTAFRSKRRYREASCGTSFSSDICEYFSLIRPFTSARNSSASFVA